MMVAQQKQQITAATAAAGSTKKLNTALANTENQPPSSIPGNSTNTNGNSTDKDKTGKSNQHNQ